MRISLEEAIDVLQKGDVVAIPTETVYGLAADARNESALQKIYAIKERPANNPLIVHIANRHQVENWATRFPVLAQQLALAFWPGPLTLVLDAKPEVSNILTAGQTTVALRVPEHLLTLALLEKSGLGLAAPSANKYTQLSPTRAAHVEHGLGNEIPVLDGGDCHVGIESTIVQVYQDENDEWQWQLLRAGMIAESTIEATIGQPSAALDKVITTKVPGQHLLHYAPRTPLLVFSTREAVLQASLTHQQNGVVCAALLLGDGRLPDCFCIILNHDPVQYAEGLYDALHRLDALQVSVILLEMPPNQPAWLAILDRLQRASFQSA